MNCKICVGKCGFLFESIVLQKYLVKYYKCHSCDFIQTEKPYWLSEAYISPIASLDVGLLQRNISLSEQVSRILETIDNKNSVYIDYGGGYGIFVRLMRDYGFNFYLSDLYAQNLFAKHFESENAELKEGFTALTAFEVFEHLVNPLEEIEKMFSLSETIIFSTELQPSDNLKSIKDWWYFVPEGGQHISLYSLNSLLHLKTFFKCHFYTNGRNLHILSKVFLSDPFKTTVSPEISIISKIKKKLFKNNSQIEMKVNRESLLMKDFDFYKKKLNNEKS